MIEFFMNPDGTFYITVEGQKSDTVGYGNIASIIVRDKLYFAVSDYFRGKLPTNTVLCIPISVEYSQEGDLDNLYDVFSVQDLPF